MTQEEFFDSLVRSAKLDQLESLLSQFQSENPDASWTPFGGRENNRGTIEASADPGRSLVERLTNGIDAILEDEHEKHKGIPECHTPKEAATAWLNVPEGGLSEMSPAQRRSIARRISITLGEGDGKSARIAEIRDGGTGLSPEEMPRTILSLNESYKITKYYLSGAYGQGGSSTLATSKYVLIASRRHDSQVGFTLARYQELPPDLYKTGHYVYLVLEGRVLTARKALEDFPAGTLIKHFGYDLSGYPSPLGPNSIYGLLNQTLFDPVLPIWLDAHETHNYRRVIKGSRNALNGAVDEGDSDQRGPALSHRVRMFFSSLGDFGRIGIEYWLLQRSPSDKRPNAAFVNPSKPIVLTLNGQTHHEISQTVIRKDAELPFLTPRFIAHIDCNPLTSAAKRSLFVSNREGARGGIVLDLIHQEIVKVLRSDDELTRLNNEAREVGTKEQDESALQNMRTEVAKLLRLQGIDVGVGISSETSTQGNTGGKGTSKRKGPRRPRPIELHEPPTYIRIIWDDGEDIPFYSEQRRYLRIETDANSNYHNPNDSNASHINIVPPLTSLSFRGSTQLEGGRLRAIFQAKAESQIGTTGTIRVELSRPGLPTVFDERRFVIAEPPRGKSTERRITLPPFELKPVENPDVQLWADLGWPDDPNSIACSAQMEEGKLAIYYSKVFPKYSDRLRALEKKDTVMAESFTKRYEIWLVVHSFLLYRDEQEAEILGKPQPLDTDFGEQHERQERCRFANIAAMVAAREVQAGQSLEGE